jgi:response regulator RpfG family c-di-GMP phosphodiesterase
MLESVTLPKDALLAVTHMYERFDGKGFPNGLAGNDIPLAARVLSVADTYADLTQNPKNPFRKVLAIEDALEELEKRSKTLFDPDVVDIVRAIATGTDLRERLLADRRSTLLIDADYEETTVLELRMIEQAFDVRVARTVENAKKLLQEERGGFDLVVSEIDLPDGDGLELLAYVKREPWGKDVPWMVHTRRSGGRDAARAFELGAVDFLAKPTASDVLVAKAKALLEERSQKRTARGVAGSLSEMTLPDIVQIIFHGKKTGKLNVRSDGQAGEIHFMSGHVANAVLGQLRGPDAFYAMMGFTHGDFGLDPTYVPSERVIHQSSEALLLEGMRRLDESLR